MRPFSTTMSIGPIGGAPVPSMTVAPRNTSRANGPMPRSRPVASATGRLARLCTGHGEFLAGVGVKNGIGHRALPASDTPSNIIVRNDARRRGARRREQAVGGGGAALRRPRHHRPAHSRFGILPATETRTVRLRHNEFTNFSQAGQIARNGTSRCAQLEAPAARGMRQIRRTWGRITAVIMRHAAPQRGIET